MTQTPKRLFSALFVLMIVTASLAHPALARGPAPVAELAHELSAAVVNIGSTRMIAGGPGVPFPDLPEGSPLKELFDNLNPNKDRGEDAMREAMSLGSGFLISAKGLIVTNNHVIEEAEEILVVLSDGTRLPAQLIGADEKTDLAVLKVEAGRDLPFVEFGDSDSARVGDWVMAIGNPFGLGGSVSLGIVSARNRDISAGPYDDFIQTDAAINQGNSGGPLFDMDGKVVGIVTAIVARGGSAMGIGFAVPGNLAQPVVDQLVGFGETRRGWLGVGIQTVTSDIASSIGRPDMAGALVVEVTQGGPSDGTLTAGDLILEFDGKAITDMRDLPRLVAATPVGKAVALKVVRRGTVQDFLITLGRLEVGEQMIAVAGDGAGPDGPARDGAGDGAGNEVAVVPGLADLIGIEIAPFSQKVRTGGAYAAGISGVLIGGVVHDSDAEQKGVTPGLVIEEVNQQKVRVVTDVVALINQAHEEGRPAVLFKLADASGDRRYIAVRFQ